MLIFKWRHWSALTRDCGLRVFVMVFSLHLLPRISILLFDWKLLQFSLYLKLQSRFGFSFLYFLKLLSAFPLLPLNKLLNIFVLIFLLFGLIFYIIDGNSFFLLLSHVDLWQRIVAVYDHLESVHKHMSIFFRLTTDAASKSHGLDIKPKLVWAGKFLRIFFANFADFLDFAEGHELALGWGVVRHIFRMFNIEVSRYKIKQIKPIFKVFPKYFLTLHFFHEVPWHLEVVEWDYSVSGFVPIFKKF